MKQFIGSIFEKVNIQIRCINPKEAVRFARKYFNGKELICAEIGVLRGENSKAMLDNLNIKDFYLIDPYEEYEDYQKDGSCRLVYEAKKIAHRKLTPYKEKTIWVEKYSEDATGDIEMLDFLYIDGNHEYDYVKKDLNLYWKKIKVGGIISGHDIDYKGVSDAVMEFVKKKNLKIFFGNKTDWWIIK